MNTGGYQNDLWRCDLATNLWTWEAGGSAGNQKGVYGIMGSASSISRPGSRQGAAVTWTDTDGNLLLFGGFGLAATNTPSYLNDVWQFTLATAIPTITQFGDAGKVTTDAGGLFDELNTLKLQPDGKLVAAGTGGGINSTVVRYRANGSLDAGFGNRGKAGAGTGDFAFVRYNADGALDASFNGTGKLLVDINGQDDGITAIALQSDGKIVAAGYETNAGTAMGNVAVVRITSGGVLDNSLNGDGKLTTDLGGNLDKATGIVIQADQKILLTATGSDNNFTVLRYTTTGDLDPGFGINGRATKDFNGRPDFANAIAVQNDSIYVAGRTYTATGDNFAVGLLLAAGNVPLPLKLVWFTATKNSVGNAVLHWQVTGLQGTATFAVEKSTDGRNFANIGHLDANDRNGTVQTLSFVDPQEIRFTTYYRVKIVETGSSFYSNVALLIPNRGSRLAVYPNPATSVVQIQTSLQGELTISIHDATGRRLTRNW